MNLCCDVLKALEGKTLCTAESLTGGGIGSAITAVSGSSRVYLGGIVSYSNRIKSRLLGVDPQLLDRVGAVSAPVAMAMAQGARKALEADVAVAVTGLAGPGGDEFGHPVGTVFIGYCDDLNCLVRQFSFRGERDAVRSQTVHAALRLILEYNGAG